jgi:hypothetical protein
MARRRQRRSHVGDLVLDGSVRTQLNTLREKLLN